MTRDILRCAMPRRLRTCIWVASVALLVACGGGSSDDTDPVVTPPPPVVPPVAPPASSASTPSGYALDTIATDTVPAGARIDVAARKLFPLNGGDSAEYTRSPSHSNGAVTAVRAVATAADASGRWPVTETHGSATTVQRYTLDAAGLTWHDPFAAEGSMPGLHAAMPSVLLYPAQFHAPGSTRVHFRQGALGADADGDGRHDYYAATFLQTFVGFEALSLFGVTVEVAHVRTQRTLVVQSVATGARRVTQDIESVWLADGIGAVRVERSRTADPGVAETYRLDLHAATVAGVAHGAARAVTNLVLPLEHEALVYDATRDVFYASMTTGSTQGNRIAIIKAGDGSVTYSAPVGSAPKALALASDGASLYVALDGSGEVVRLRLPGLTELARVRMPLSGFFGAGYVEELAASPTSPDVFAASLYAKGVSPRHQGVVLVRNAVVQPTATAGHTGANSIGFDSTGAWLYGYNNETTEFGLRRIEVVPDGVVERRNVFTDGSFRRRLRIQDAVALVGNRAYRADDSLALLGEVSGGTDCIKLPSLSRIVCHSDDLDDGRRLIVADAVTFTPTGSVFYAPSAPDVTNGRWQLVPGRTGQVAISEDNRVVLFSDPLLR